VIDPSPLLGGRVDPKHAAQSVPRTSRLMSYRNILSKWLTNKAIRVSEVGIGLEPVAANALSRGAWQRV
jgi:hypothetical protein